MVSLKRINSYKKHQDELKKKKTQHHYRENLDVKVVKIQQLHV